MAEMDWAELESLMTRPLSEAELAQYSEVLASQDFQDMVRHYHANSALTTIRQVVAAWIQQGISLEVMLRGLVHVWLDCLVRIEARIDADTQQSWREMPTLLVQILFLQAVDMLNENRSRLNNKVPPELEEMYAQWAKILPTPEADPPDGDTELARLNAQVAGLYQDLTLLRTRLEATGLRLEGNDYLEIWTMVVLQAFIFGHVQAPELYYAIEVNWELYLDRLSGITTMMFLLKGYETLLLPENRHQLAELLQTDAFKATLEQYLEED